jgi:hypothetical protein
MVAPTKFLNGERDFLSPKRRGLSCLKDKRIWICQNQKFFIPLKNYQNINVESEFTLSIWKYELRVIVKIWFKN